MPEKVNINMDFGIIQINSFGEVTEPDLLHSLEEVLKIKQEHGLTRVLVDTTKQVSLPDTFSLHHFASMLSKEVRDMKHAIVVTQEQEENLQFIETAAENRGVVMKVFDSYDDALAWLRE